uniref:Ras-associating domain-containing protein n=1 Tax=Oncorhynchus kisutch TaxID=8019 RepID=A0A8C7G983_ONCKI
IELKVWVEGLVRVVCGLSLETPCQDVVIALAQVIGQTGRYVLIQKLRGTEKQLVADDCPLESLLYLGQLAIKVQFILRCTGTSSSDGLNRHTLDRVHPLPRHPTPQMQTVEEGPHFQPWSFYKPDPSKKEVFRQVMQQQEMLQDLEAQLVALEREAEVWEMGRHVTPLPGLNPGLVEELDVLEMRLRPNVAWGVLFVLAVQISRDVLCQLNASMDKYSFRLKDLQTHSSRLGQDSCVEAQRLSSRPGTPPPEEAMGALREELHNWLQQGGGARRVIDRDEESFAELQSLVDAAFRMLMKIPVGIEPFPLSRQINLSYVETLTYPIVLDQRLLAYTLRKKGPKRVLWLSP